MTRSYQLSDTSVKKLSKFLANPKYQPPKKRRDADEIVIPQQSVDQVAFYVSEEDRYEIPRYWFWARRCAVNKVVASGTPYEKVYDWPQNGARMLLHMRAGLLMQVANIGGTLYYQYGPPPPTSYGPSPAIIYANESSGSTTYEHEAEVGTAFSLFIAYSGIGSYTPVTAADLPPGISFTQLTSTLEGTPTTVGDYFVKITGATAGGNAIRLVRITVYPSGGGPGGPIEEP